MNNLEGDLRNLLNGYSQKDLLGIEQILEFSFMLMAHPNPEPWVEKFISKRYPEDLISLILSLSIPTANFIKQLQSSDMPEWQKEQISTELAATAEGIYNKLGSLIDVNNLEKNMQIIEESLQRFMKEDAWTRSLLVVRNTPSLLQLDSDFALVSMQVSAFLASDEKAVDFFQAHRNLLAECRRSSVDKVVKDRYPFVQRLSDGLNETMMLIYSGMDSYGYGDIPFPDVYEYAKKIIKNPENLMSIKLDYAMGRYMLLLKAPQNWEKGKSLLEKVRNWIKTFGDEYDDDAVRVLKVQTELSYGTYWMNKFAVEKNIKDIDEAIGVMKTALKIAPVDEDIIAIYSGLYKAVIGKYQVVNKKELLIEAIEILKELIAACERFESEYYYGASFTIAVCYSIMYTNHQDSESLEKASQIFEKIIAMPDTPDDVRIQAKSGLGKIALGSYKEKNDLSSLDLAIKNLKESVDE